MTMKKLVDKFTIYYYHCLVTFKKLNIGGKKHGYNKQ